MLRKTKRISIKLKALSRHRLLVTLRQIWRVFFHQGAYPSKLLLNGDRIGIGGSISLNQHSQGVDSTTVLTWYSIILNRIIHSETGNDQTSLSHITRQTLMKLFADTVFCLKYFISFCFMLFSVNFLLLFYVNVNL